MTAQTYAGERRLLDADSHIMELPDFLTRHADPSMRERLPKISYSRSSVDEGEAWALARAGGHSRDYANDLASLDGRELVAGPKEEKALGAFDPDDRRRALDRLGFERQLVFSTLSGTVVFDRNQGPEIQYAATRAHNRGMLDFCSGDARLMPIVIVPLEDPQRALAELDEILPARPGAIWVPHCDAGGRSPGHIDFEPFWARLAEASVPFVLHVGGFPLQVPEVWANNGRPAPRDWMGGGENVRGKDFAILHQPAERFLSLMVLDGVFERHPGLKGASVELGAKWAPGLLERLDDIVAVFGRMEPDLKTFSRLPSQQLREQFAFTPYPFEKVGSLFHASDPCLYLFSSDYPHAEGSRDPLGPFDRGMEGCSPVARQAFFHGNFERIFGAAGGSRRAEEQTGGARA
jgi:predicted TIM-barrel fold metal-dependent hydrolase